MAEAAVLAAVVRKETGKRRMRRLRKAGQIPGVMYGHKEETIPLAVKAEDLWALIRHGQRVVDVKLDGKTEKCLIREVQWDVFGREVLHVDLTRVSADERIRVTVPIHLRGNAAGVAAGGVLDQPLHTLEIECPALAVPEAIRVNVQDLQLDQAIHVKDLKLPEGVVALADPEAVVVQCAKPLEEAAAEAVEGPAEPEVIGRKAAEEEGEAEK
ncbi:MAG: 50S ribosomal protein L25 [Gemmatales bacterium]|nr:50S ribosomal protein L25 [Gemmatales bacterium]MDW8386335.1 50S ribosomal protein L25 [Gemmatales bacterium]